jgi:hypothetical protein
MLAERIRINAENIDANQEYRNICFDAVIKAFYQDEEGHKETEMDVDDLADSRNMDSLPMGAEVPETPPDTAGIMGRRGMSSDNTLQRYGAKGVRSQNSSQNLKRNRKRKSGGKTNTKRKAKAERMNNFGKIVLFYFVQIVHLQLRMRLDTCLMMIMMKDITSELCSDRWKSLLNTEKLTIMDISPSTTIIV